MKKKRFFCFCAVYFVFGIACIGQASLNEGLVDSYLFNGNAGVASDDVLSDKFQSIDNYVTNTYLPDSYWNSQVQSSNLRHIANNEEVYRLKLQIEGLRNNISTNEELQSKIETKNDKSEIEYRLKILQNELADAVHDYAKAMGKIIRINGKKTYQKQNSSDLFDPTYKKTGNIIVLKIKPEYISGWEWFADYWYHAAIFSGWNNTANDINILEAPGTNHISQTIPFSDWIENHPWYFFDSAIVVNFDFNKQESDSMVNFHNNKQIGVPYPVDLGHLLLSKYDYDTFYCSSLVWRAHKDSGRFLDLDDEHPLSLMMVWPSELFTDKDSEDKVWSVDWEDNGEGPEAATLLYPSGIIKNSNVAFSWNLVTGSTWYQLCLRDPTGKDHYEWHEASGICSFGTCAVKPTMILSEGNYIWWVQTYNSKGYGPWSEPLSFTLNSVDYSITSPIQGSTFTSNSVTFQWTPGAYQYWMYIGSSTGSSNYYDSGPLTGSSKTVSSLPSDGSTVYVRFYYTESTNNDWKHKDYTYKAHSSTSYSIISPIPGSTFTSNSVTFQWTPGAYQYWMYIGSSTGSSNYYDSGPLTGSSKTVSSLPSDGSTVYVRFYYKKFSISNWEYKDYSYKASSRVISFQDNFDGTEIDSNKWDINHIWNRNNIDLTKYFLSPMVSNGRMILQDNGTLPSLTNNNQAYLGLRSASKCLKGDFELITYVNNFQVKTVSSSSEGWYGSLYIRLETTSDISQSKLIHIRASKGNEHNGNFDGYGLFYFSNGIKQNIGCSYDNGTNCWINSNQITGDNTKVRVRRINDKLTIFIGDNLLHSFSGVTTDDLYVTWNTGVWNEISGTLKNYLVEIPELTVYEGSN